ncbi:MAG: GGDEF domain-containing protein [Bacilli bacterium]|jgi:diguanylate cyclase (GGDEF)-like protein
MKKERVKELKEDLIKENNKYTKILNNKDLPETYKYLIDDLTQLLNQKFFFNNIKFLTLSMIEGTINNEQIFSLLYCDIDGLKFLNDTKGHQIGDKGIKVIADIIKESIRTKREDFVDNFFLTKELKENIAIRVGGDEFIIILPNCSKELAESKVANRIKNNIKNNPYHLGLSIGITDTKEVTLPPSLSDKDLKDYFQNIINLAEKRMYEDKVKSKGNQDQKHNHQIILNNNLRLCDSLGLDYYNEEDYLLLKKEMDLARNTLLQKEKKK